MKIFSLIFSSVIGFFAFGSIDMAFAQDLKYECRFSYQDPLGKPFAFARMSERPASDVFEVSVSKEKNRYSKTDFDVIDSFWLFKENQESEEARVTFSVKQGLLKVYASLSPERNAETATVVTVPIGINEFSLSLKSEKVTSDQEGLATDSLDVICAL